MAFRNTSFACPGCRESLAAGAAIAWCNGCRGVWVSEAELEERVRIVRGMNELNLEVVFGPGDSSSAQTPRPCPLCRQPLGHATLGTIEVDRCDQKHGIWFDVGELEHVLRASTEGVAVTIPAVEYGPQEREALERIRVESIQNASSPTVVDAVEAVFWIVRVIVNLLT
ncbi:MAG TPA: zf-TFIIB domain-containing protein [Haliangium sp.]|nr:zf-TFIIB domain-containing protein [Haliangium sp.]